MLHLIVHYLDDIRSQGDSTLSWNSVKGNVGAMPYCGAVAALFWPRLRKFILGEAHIELEKLKAEHDKLKAEHEQEKAAHAALKAKVAA